MLRSNVITKSTLLSFKENTLKTYYVNENGSFDREVRLSKWRKFERITVDNVSSRSSDNLSESHHQSLVWSLSSLSLEKPLYKNWLVSFPVMLLAARLKRSESVVTVQSISWIIRLLGFGSWWHRLKGDCSKLRSVCNLPLLIWWKKTLLTSHVKKTSRHEIQTFSYQIYIKRLLFHHACRPYGKEQAILISRQTQMGCRGKTITFSFASLSV